MVCTECIKGFELIELPVGSSIDSIKSARKTWHKNLHPDVWQNKPGWKGAASQLTNVNLAIDHLLQCDGVSTETSSHDVDLQSALRQAAELIELMGKEREMYRRTPQEEDCEAVDSGEYVDDGSWVTKILTGIVYTGCTLFAAFIVWYIYLLVGNKALGLNLPVILATAAGSIFLLLSVLVIRSQWNNY